MTKLNNIALEILGNGKGILAADESTGTMTKRLDSVNVPSTAENRLLFRETLFSSSSMTNCIGGVILYDETIKQISSKKNKIPEKNTIILGQNLQNGEVFILYQKITRASYQYIQTHML